MSALGRYRYCLVMQCPQGLDRGPLIWQTDAKISNCARSGETCCRVLGIIYLTPQDAKSGRAAPTADLPEAGAPVVTPQMIQAGVDCYWRLSEVRASDELVREVYQAMLAVAPGRQV